MTEPNGLLIEAMDKLVESVGGNMHHLDAINRAVSDIEQLHSLCAELLAGADKCSQAPHYIVQPFMGIVKRHSKIINRRKLL